MAAASAAELLESALGARGALVLGNGQTLLQFGCELLAFQSRAAVASDQASASDQVGFIEDVDGARKFANILSQFGGGAVVSDRPLWAKHMLAIYTGQIFHDANTRTAVYAVYAASATFAHRPRMAAAEMFAMLTKVRARDLDLLTITAPAVVRTVFRPGSTGQTLKQDLRSDAALPAVTEQLLTVETVLRTVSQHYRGHNGTGLVGQRGWSEVNSPRSFGQTERRSLANIAVALYTTEPHDPRTRLERADREAAEYAAMEDASATGRGAPVGGVPVIGNTHTYEDLTR